MQQHTIVHLPARELVHICKLADAVERAFELFEREECNKLHGLPHDLKDAQRQIDLTTMAYDDATCPKSILALAVELLAARNAELERQINERGVTP